MEKNKRGSGRDVLKHNGGCILKNFVIGLILLLLLSISYCCDVIEQFTIHPEIIKYKYDINTLMVNENITDLKSAWRWVANNIEYKIDTLEWFQYDDWQSAEETLQKRKGDCEDFCILLGEFLHRLGYETALIIIPRGDGYHAILQVGGLFIEPQVPNMLYTEFNVARYYTYERYRDISINDILRGIEDEERRPDNIRF